MLKNMTWHDVLIEKGIDPSSAKALISFVSWNENTEYPHLGDKITSIISSNPGSIFVKDAVSNKYRDRGLLFLDRNLPGETVTSIFNIIMDYEQEDIYRI